MVWAECREIISRMKFCQTSNNEVLLPSVGLMRKGEKTIMNEREGERERDYVQRATSQEL